MRTYPTHYFDSALDELGEVIATAKEDLADVEFDTLVGTGLSGAIVVPALALAMDKSFLLVRKDQDDSHHGGGRLVGRLGLRWVFVDDFVSTGRTRTRVMTKISAADTRSFRPRMVGQYLYMRSDGGDPTVRFQPFEEDWARRIPSQSSSAITGGA